MCELVKGSCCFPTGVVGVNVGLACVDGIIAALAFTQLIRIHSRNAQLGWTRQKVFYMLIGSSNIGYFLYFVITVIASCKEWRCWSYSCGFIFMAFPRILSFAAFLLLLSFWIDLCHQGDDEDHEEDDFSFHEALLERTIDETSFVNSHRICLPLRSIRVGSRQRIVIWATALVFVLMMVFAVLIWFGIGNTPTDSSVLAKVYIDIFAAAMLFLGLALAFYGVLLCLKMRSVRFERAASEIWKVAGLAVISVICFTSSALVAFLPNFPVLYYCQQLDKYTSILLILYYFIGSSIPSAFLLWIMRELPHPIIADVHQESRTITFFSGSSAVVQNPEHWTTTTSSQSQIISWEKDKGTALTSAF